MKIFDFLVVQPITSLLSLLYELSGSVFLSLFGLTLFLKLLFLPLNLKSLRAQARLQELGKEIEKIQKRFKDDKERMGKEILKLYSSAGINPFSPLVLLLVQLPVWIALYRLLLSDRLPFPSQSSFLGLAFTLQEPSVVIAFIGALLQLLFSVFNRNQQKNNKAIPSQIVFLFPFVSFVVFSRLPSIVSLYFAFSTLLSLGESFFVLEWERIKNPKRFKDEQSRDIPSKTGNRKVLSASGNKKGTDN